MRHLVYLTAARRDLVSIVRYISRESGSRIVGQRFVEQIRSHCRTLAELPGILGRPRPELSPDLRSSPFRGYIVFFRYSGSTVEIVRILEGHRDVSTQFGAKSPE